MRRTTLKFSLAKSSVDRVCIDNTPGELDLSRPEVAESAPRLRTLLYFDQVHLTTWYKLSQPFWILALVFGVVLLAIPTVILITIRRKQTWIKTLTDMLVEAYMWQAVR